MATAEEGGARPTLLSRLAQDHVRVFFFSLGKLAQNPVGSFLTALVIGITLALPAGLHIVTQNLSAISYSWEGSLQMSLFLKDSVSRDQGVALATELAGRPGVVHSEYISREQSLGEFRELSGFGEALDILQENPLPAVIAITPNRAQSKSQIDQMLHDFTALPQVELAKMDQKWLERLYAILAIVERAVFMIASLLALAVIVIVGNTIRLDIEARREEIVVMKLIGAPDSFIRRPFLYTGFWYGLSGAVFALALIVIGMLAIAGPSRQLAELYESTMLPSGIGFGDAVLLLLSGILLGLLGAFWTVTRHLSKIEPQ
ncbi:MAG TPA: permease-like cell division protein FtsX [Solimonas sp.]|nr:permease-like cell division protein FtsX [Solimonas sp.]